jgi:hypothetical protein
LRTARRGSSAADAKSLHRARIARKHPVQGRALASCSADIRRERRALARRYLHAAGDRR